MKKLAIIATFSMLVLPVFAFAQFIPPDVNSSGQVVVQGASSDTGLSACRTISSTGVAGVVACLIGFMNNALYVIMAAAVLYIVWGAFQLMKEEKRDEAKNTVMYGIIGLFVMISIWGLVNILSQTFNLTGPAVKPPELIAK